jgi:hypothetical protein
VRASRAVGVAGVVLLATSCGRPSDAQVEADFARLNSGPQSTVRNGRVLRVEFSHGLSFTAGTARVYFTGSCPRFDGTDGRGDCGPGANYRYLYRHSDGQWKLVQPSAIGWDLP